eukprot:1829541-Ditylum_brightwellii.AAC.1
MLINSLANGKNALSWIGSYLALEEVKPYVKKILPTFMNGQSSGGTIEMSNANSSANGTTNNELLSSKAAAPAMCDASLSVSSGEIVAIVGPVGS